MVDIVIVNWKSGPRLEKCVRSLLRHAPGCPVFVVDNHSQDGSLDFPEARDQRVAVIRNTFNAGFAAACNQGWRSGKDELVLFVNPDAECLPSGVEVLAKRLERDPGLWAAGGCLLDPDGAHQAGFNVRAFPTVGSVAAESLLIEEIWPRNPWTRRYRMAGWDHDSPCDVDQPAAACLMVRRAKLEILQGFDGAFHPAWFEDVDLCKRIHEAGGRIGYEPGARFVHHGGVSLGALAKGEFLRIYHANQIHYFVKHHGRRAAANVKRLVVAGLCLRAVLAAMASLFGIRTRLAPAGACWNAARHISGIREAAS